MLDTLIEQESALGRFANQVQTLDQPWGLERAAATAAAFAFPEVSEREVTGQLDELAAEVQGFPGFDSFESRLAKLNYILFVVRGFRVANPRQPSPAHAMLHLCLRTSVGSSRLLALVYHLVATRVGISTRPIWCRGTILVAVAGPERTWILDPSQGGEMVGEVTCRTADSRLEDAHAAPQLLSAGDNQLADRHLWLEMVLAELAHRFEIMGAESDRQIIGQMRRLAMPPKIARFASGR